MLPKIKKLLSTKEKRYLVILVLFSIVISLIETFAVSILMPFIAVASDLEKLETNKYLAYIYHLLGIGSPIMFVVYFGIFLSIFYLFRAGFNLYYHYMLSRFSEEVYFSVSRELFSKYLGLSYQAFNRLHTAHLTKMIVNEASYFAQVISSLLVMISEFFVIVFIYTILLYVDWAGTLILSSILVIVVGLMLRRITLLIKRKGKEREVYQRQMYDILAASFGNFKVIKLFADKEKTVGSFTKAVRRLTHSNIVFETSSHIPRLLLDGMGFALLSLMVVFLVWRYQADISTFMPILSLYILALYRLLPSVHRIIIRYNKVMYYAEAIEQVSRELSYAEEHLGSQEIVFTREISLKKVSFSYGNNRVLKSINMCIQRGSSIGIVGESGSGKSTLVDLIIGLNLPSEGAIYIDDISLNLDNIVSWRKRIGYIPQHVYLFDGTVAENITFGRAYDEQKLIQLLKQVRLWDFLMQRDGLATSIGERGKLLSGGQRQRVAIARALYEDPDVLVLDEATSALDKKIEQEIINEIYDLAQKKTLVIISHNEELLDRCDEVYRVKEKHLFKERSK